MKLVKEQVCRDIPGQECKIELVSCGHDGDYGGGEDGTDSPQKWVDGGEEVVKGRADDRIVFTEIQIQIQIQIR